MALSRLYSLYDYPLSPIITSRPVSTMPHTGRVHPLVAEKGKHQQGYQTGRTACHYRHSAGGLYALHTPVTGHTIGYQPGGRALFSTLVVSTSRPVSFRSLAGYQFTFLVEHQPSVEYHSGSSMIFCYNNVRW